MDKKRFRDILQAANLVALPAINECKLDTAEETRTTPNHQCLIFVVNGGRQKNKKHVSISLTKQNPVLYLLFPSKITNSYPKFCDSFKNEYVHVINKDTQYQLLNSCAENSTFEVVEMLFSEPNYSHSHWVSCYQMNSHDEDYIRPLLFRCVRSVYPVKYTSSYSSSDSRKILSAVDEENLEFIQSLLANRADLCYRHSNGGTLLHLAVWRGHKSLVRLLLKCGANISAEMNDGSCALHLAAKRGYLDLVKLLLNSGLSVNAKTKGGSTPLLEAVAKRQIVVVEHLLKTGADVNTKAVIDPNRPKSAFDTTTPLHLAVGFKNMNLIQLLLSFGADVNVETNFRFRNRKLTPFQVSVELMCPKIVHCLLKYRPELKNARNKEAFCYAASSGRFESHKIFNMLLQYGFDVDSDDVDNLELLHGAIRKNSCYIVRKLLEYGAQVNQPRGRGYFSATPLHTAAKFSNEKMVQLLLDFGADIDAKCDQGMNAIYKAVDSSNLKVIKLLLAKKASAAVVPDLMKISAKLRSDQNSGTSSKIEIE